MWSDPSVIRTIKNLLEDWQYWAEVREKLDELYDYQKSIKMAA